MLRLVRRPRLWHSRWGGSPVEAFFASVSDMYVVAQQHRYVALHNLELCGCAEICRSGRRAREQMFAMQPQIIVLW